MPKQLEAVTVTVVMIATGDPEVQGVGGASRETGCRPIPLAASCFFATKQVK